MTEQEWMTCGNPLRMLDLLNQSQQFRVSDRKLRLFACACCRRIWHLLEDERSRGAVEIAEQFADERSTQEEIAATIALAERALSRLRRHWGAASSQAGAARAAQALGRVARRAAEHAANHAMWAEDWEVSEARRIRTNLSRIVESEEETRHRVRDQLDHFQDWQCTLLRDIVGNPFRPVLVEPAWLLWDNGILPKLAQTAYEERILPSGIFDSQRLAILADALEEAGCTNPEILGHLRGPGSHVRGCHVLDLLLCNK